ncbi:MAG: carbon storage regulator [Planctomycetota bacterium]
MLVLSRKTTERIQIGDDITVEVRRIAGNRVTLAVVAPRDVRILRGELVGPATEFEKAPEIASSASPAAATDAATQQDDHPATEPYVVSHRRVPAPAPTPTGDLSDHGMSAYAVG